MDADLADLETYRLHYQSSREEIMHYINSERGAYRYSFALLSGQFILVSRGIGDFLGEFQALLILLVPFGFLYLCYLYTTYVSRQVMCAGYIENILIPKFATNAFSNFTTWEKYKGVAYKKSKFFEKLDKYRQLFFGVAPITSVLLYGLLKLVDKACPTWYEIIVLVLGLMPLILPWILMKKIRQFTEVLLRRDV